VSGGVDAIIVENLGDAPFASAHVAPYTVAAMTRVVTEIVGIGVPVGVNVLRNDARAALSIAAATGAHFMRVNVHTGVMATDQGLLTGGARETLLERNRLGVDVVIAADVHVKHAAPLGDSRLEDAAHDTWHRGQANVLIVTGSGTGQPTDGTDVQRVRGAVPEATIWVGSGLRPGCPLPDGANGAIVGTWLHRDSCLSAPVSEPRVAEIRALLH
jgi:uncharacterized protein